SELSLRRRFAFLPCLCFEARFRFPLTPSSSSLSSSSSLWSVVDKSVEATDDDLRLFFDDLWCRCAVVDFLLFFDFFDFLCLRRCLESSSESASSDRCPLPVTSPSSSSELARDRFLCFRCLR